ncbi:MAG: polysaccharide deacetylase family protein [Selenomonadaceae bacterium]|nr:polysaccharide deacetylase family protein [Selenomonadaceae bacterium]
MFAEVKTLRLIGVAFLILTAIIFLLPEPEGFPILEYHQVTDEPLDPDFEVYNVPPAEFAAQLDYLAAAGYTTITLQDFMRVVHGKGELPEKPIVLTFDDGYADNYSTMLPILEAHNMTAVVYVITNELGKKNYLTLEQLKDMQRRGIEIGSHTADHLPLTSLDKNAQRRQISDSKIFLEWSGLQTIYSLSYPNGAFNSELEEILREENFLTAVTGEAGLNTLATNPYELCRVHIRKPRFGLTEFKFRLWKAKFFAKLRAL